MDGVGVAGGEEGVQEGVQGGKLGLVLCERGVRMDELRLDINWVK